MCFYVRCFVSEALHKDHNALSTQGSRGSYQVFKDEREAFVSVDDVV